MSGPIFGLYSEHVSVVFRGIGFIQSKTRQNSTTSTIAEASIDITRSSFVRSCQRSTIYRLKRSNNVAVFACGVKSLEKTPLDCLAVCSEFPPEKPNINQTGMSYPY